MSDNDEFYVGYMKTAPARTGRKNRLRIVGLTLLGLGLAALLAWGQRGYGPGTWDLKERSFTGWLEAGAVPSLAVLEPGAGDAPASFVRHTLVSPFKFGFQNDAAPLDQQMVSLKGTLIERDGQRMIEVTPGTIVASATNPLPATPAPEEALGPHTFRGEIVDSKCYLGVMNPGNLKTHRACAVRCISGGIPPVLLVRDTEGRASYIHLVGTDDAAVNEAVLPLVAEPIEVKGKLFRKGNLLLLKADPASYSRL